MNWYLAKIVFQIICGAGTHKPQFDEQVRLIAAHNEKEAFIKAALLGSEEQESFLNQKKQTVQWKFVNVPELYPVFISDGSELCSRINEVEDAVSYLQLVNAKAAQIQSKTASALAV